MRAFPQESGILLTDIAAAYPSVNHPWILSVLEKTELPDFISRFLRSIYSDSNTHVEFAGATWGQFLMARGVRRGCPGSGFLFARAFYPIFRWLQEAVIPRNLTTCFSCSLPNVLTLMTSLLQPCGFRGLMTELAPAFHSVDYFAGLNLNNRKCCWVQYGSEGHESLWHWLSENCEEFREIQNVRRAIYVGTMIGPDGYIHR